MALTQKQENFCLKYVECGNASEAYRHAYDANKMSAETIHKRAFELMNNGNVTGRIEELKSDHRKRHNITIDDLLDELEEARTCALTCETPQSSAAVSATIGKAKLLGLDKQIIENTHRIIDDGSHEW